MTLYINCCVRTDSRTDTIARALLAQREEPYTELYLPEEALQPLSEKRLETRTKLIEAGAYDDPMFRYARQFAAADRIVIAAPYWDLSFPALLKLYIENIYVTGIVSEYGPDGMPHGLCRAQELIYVTTAGGPYVPDYSFGYLKELAEHYLGIPHTRLVKAEMLDVDGFDPAAIVAQTIAEL